MCYRLPGIPAAKPRARGRDAAHGFVRFRRATWGDDSTGRADTGVLAVENGYPAARLKRSAQWRKIMDRASRTTTVRRSAEERDEQVQGGAISNSPGASSRGARAQAAAKAAAAAVAAVAVTNPRRRPQGARAGRSRVVPANLSRAVLPRMRTDQIPAGSICAECCQRAWTALITRGGRQGHRHARTGDVATFVRGQQHVHRCKLGGSNPLRRAPPITCWACEINTSAKTGDPPARSLTLESPLCHPLIEFGEVSRTDKCPHVRARPLPCAQSGVTTAC